MIRVAFVRGKYLNNSEGQNYRFNRKKIKLTGISSKTPLDTKVPFPLIKLFSPADYQGHFLKIIANRTLGDMHMLFGLDRYQSKFDIFHSADLHYYYSYQLAKLRQKNKIPHLLLTSWETIPFNNESVERKKRIKYFTMSQADSILCHTERAKQCLIKEGADLKKIRVIKLGVDLTRFKPKRKKGNELTVLFVGRLVEEKGIMDSYEAFKLVKKTFPEKILTFRIIGAGPLKNKLKMKIRNQGLDRYVLIEQEPYNSMPSVYQQANIFCVPSKRTKTWEEQYGMVFIEAMASAIPILTYDTGAIKENVEKTGVFVQEGNIGDLSDKLQELISNEALRIKLGTIGRERAVRSFDCKKTAKKLEKLYAQLATSSQL